MGSKLNEWRMGIDSQVIYPRPPRLSLITQHSSLIIHHLSPIIITHAIDSLDSLWELIMTYDSSLMTLHSSLITHHSSLITHHSFEWLMTHDSCLLPHDSSRDSGLNGGGEKDGNQIQMKEGVQNSGTKSEVHMLKENRWQRCAVVGGGGGGRERWRFRDRARDTAYAQQG